MNTYKTGDRVKVVRPEMTFGDYELGDTAVIRYVRIVEGRSLLSVKWDAPRFMDHREACRVELLYSREVELVGAANE